MYGSSRYRKINHSGQSALIDSILFFMLMLIASAILVSFVAFFLAGSPAVSFYYQQTYTNNFLNSALSSTVNSTEYTANSGSTVYINGTYTVLTLIGEYLFLSASGIPASSLTNITGMIHSRFNLGVIAPYHYALYASYSGTYGKSQLFFTDPFTSGITDVNSVPVTRTSSSDYCTVGNQQGQVWLYVWSSGV